MQKIARGTAAIAGAYRMTRSTAVILMCLTLVASFAPGVFADVLLNIGEGTGNPADTVVIPVSIASIGGSAAAALNFDVAFDQTRLAINPAAVACAASCQAAGKSAAAALPAPGVLRIIVFGLNTNAIPDGELVRLPFVIVGGASGCAELICQNVTVSDPDAGEIPAICLEGAIQISPCVLPEIGGLTFLDKIKLSWTAAPRCPGVSYDVLRGQLDRLPVGSQPASETCVASGLSITQKDDPSTPPLGKGFWYLVREKETGCPAGTYGPGRVSSTCPP
jgi:hypothetical protein